MLRRAVLEMGARRSLTGPHYVVIVSRCSMQRMSLVVTGLMICSLLISLPVLAATPGRLPPEQTQGAVAYVSGGIGQDEAQAFEAAAAQYPLALEFAIKHTPRAEYTAYVHVVVTDTQGKRVLDTTTDGPFLLAKLPAGRYTVTAERHQQTLTRTVHVATHKPTHVMFLWAV